MEVSDMFQARDTKTLGIVISNAKNRSKPMTQTPKISMNKLERLDRLTILSMIEGGLVRLL